MKTSIIDHIYVTDPFYVSKISHFQPLIGDHTLISFVVNAKYNKPKTIWKRNWSNYSKNLLINALSLERFDIETDTVQDTWNLFESTLLPIIDILAPLTLYTKKESSNKPPSPIIKSKINARRKLLNKLKLNPSNPLRGRIKNLNIEIKSHFAQNTKNFIRKKIQPGNSKSLWDAVKIAKNISIPPLPQKMTLNDVTIDSADLPDAFANYFKNKVSNIVTEQVIDDLVHNGQRKIWTTDHHFMSLNNIQEAVKSLKNKQCEGHDRIPQRILIDGIVILQHPLSYLFNQIYIQKTVPEQWLIAKVTPIFKKGKISKIKNYRLISNLCSASKFFEKIILIRLQKLEKFKNVDLTGKSQHGFKAKHSTMTAGLKLQSVIARALDDDEYALMS